MSRREFLKGIQPKKGGIPILQKEKCTGCGLCAMDCPTGALTLLQNRKEDTYQLLFRHDLCNACGKCETSCPEKCLRLETGFEMDKRKKVAEVIFEDGISRCSGCGIPLFPEAMVNHLKLKVLGRGNFPWPFDLCPSCRIKTHFQKERVGKSQG
jgi:ferredoxin